MTSLDPVFPKDEIQTIRVKSIFDYPSKTFLPHVLDLCRNVECSHGKFQCTWRCVHPRSIKSYHRSWIHTDEYHQTKTKSTIPWNFSSTFFCYSSQERIRLLYYWLIVIWIWLHHLLINRILYSLKFCIFFRIFVLKVQMVVKNERLISKSIVNHYWKLPRNFLKCISMIIVLSLLYE